MITLMPHDTAWIDLFIEETKQLLRLLNIPNLRIDHIGSTAIPTIMAKPVIDILIGVPDITQFSTTHCQLIESLGYRYVPAFEEVMPYRRYFQKNNSEGVRTHQIHVVTYPSAWWEKHNLFK